MCIFNACWSSHTAFLQPDMSMEIRSLMCVRDIEDVSPLWVGRITLTLGMKR